MKRTLPITRNTLFKKLYSKGKSAASSDIILYCMKNPSGVNRLGITVSTKIGCAVVRNRVRRRIREAYRMLEDNVAPGVNVVVVARSAAENRKMQQICGSLKQLLKKTDIWVENHE